MKKILFVGLFVFSSVSFIGAMEPEKNDNVAEQDVPVQCAQLSMPRQLGEYLLSRGLERLLVADLMIHIVGQAEIDDDPVGVRLTCEGLWEFIERVEHQVGRYCKQYDKDFGIIRASMPAILCGCFINNQLASLAALTTYYGMAEYFRRYPLMQTLDLNYDAGPLIPGYEFESIFYVGLSEFIHELFRCGAMPHENELGRLRQTLQERYEHAPRGEHEVKNVAVYKEALDFVVSTILRLQYEYHW